MDGGKDSWQEAAHSLQQKDGGQRAEDSRQLAADSGQLKDRRQIADLEFRIEAKLSRAACCGLAAAC
jgi:hypothetical protein